MVRRNILISASVGVLLLLLAALIGGASFRLYKLRPQKTNIVTSETNTGLPNNEDAAKNKTLTLPQCKQDEAFNSIASAFKHYNKVCFLFLQKDSVDDLRGLEKEFTNLKILVLSNANIDTIPFNIALIKTIEVLDLRNNGLKRLPNNIGDLRSLKILKLSNNNFSIDEKKRIRNVLVNTQIEF